MSADSLATAPQWTAVAVHPSVVGEIACGGLKRGSTILELMAALPQATRATHDEVLHVLARHALGGRGIGYVDAHLLASAAINGISLWTRDKALRAQSERLDLACAER